MIKNMQHTYMQHGTKYFAFIEPIRSEREAGQETQIADAHNFYIFDANGWCWLQMLHVDIKYVMKELGNGFFEMRMFHTIDEPVDAFRKPTVNDEWTQGNFDRGYALETLKEGLGLNLTHLTALMEHNLHRDETCSKRDI